MALPLPRALLKEFHYIWQRKLDTSFLGERGLDQAILAQLLTQFVSQVKNSNQQYLPCFFPIPVYHFSALNTVKTPWSLTWKLLVSVGWPVVKWAPDRKLADKPLAQNLDTPLNSIYWKHSIIRFVSSHVQNDAECGRVWRHIQGWEGSNHTFWNFPSLMGLK